MICPIATTDPLIQDVLDAEPQTALWLNAVLTLIHDGDHPLSLVRDLLDWQQQRAQEKT